MWHLQHSSSQPAVRYVKAVYVDIGICTLKLEKLIISICQYDLLR